MSEGHPDKVADFVADAVLDAYLERDPEARVACEVLCKGSHVVLAGEITAHAQLDLEPVVRAAVAEVGYDDPGEPFCSATLEVQSLITAQSVEIARAIDGQSEGASQVGAGDQGIMFGYATDETPELMPLPILLAHRVVRWLAEDRRAGTTPWLLPDAKSQVSVHYVDGRPIRVSHVVISTQHRPWVSREAIEQYIRDRLLPNALGEWWRMDVPVSVNPSGSFLSGGPEADCGLTGRKNIVDTYGGAARQGGGALSGKDPTKVDRSATYFARYVARQVVREGLAQRVEIQVAYAIGEPDPVAIAVETFGTGDLSAVSRYVAGFDFRPGAIIERLDLRRPIYRQTTNYGHFGKPYLPWEA